MTDQETNNVSNILNEINKTINVIGTERLIEILQYSRKLNITITEEQLIKAHLIIETVCEEFEIDKEELFSTNRKNSRRYAVGSCALFFQNILGIDNVEIAHILKTLQSVTSSYKSDVLNLKSSHPQDAKIINKIENIKRKLNNLENGIQ
jgi:chromosomal replication initiation ATPase DnaA